MSEQLNIEQLVRSKLEDKQITPSAGTWKRIRRKMRWKQFMRFDPGRFNIFYTAGILVIGAGVITLTRMDPTADRPKDRPVRQQPAQQEITAPVEEYEEVNPVEAERKEETRQEMRTGTGEQIKESETVPGTGEQSAAGEEAGKEKVAGQQETGRQPGGLQASGKVEEDAPEVPTPGTMIAYFTSSVQSGCAPLTVQFFNRSVNHTTVSWSMGTGLPVTGEDQVYTFDEPGQHHVTMTAMNAEGQTSSFHQVIRVYPVPEADFEIEEGIRSSQGPETYELINYSVGTISCRWDLAGEDKTALQGWSSEEFQPSLRLTELAKQSKYIRLVATNEHGCSHTAFREIPEPPGSQAPQLSFPTAFSPNTAGPTGGHYSPHEKRNDVFYPVFETAPLEYRLRIYTRRGELVFQTDDIYQGWDGYYLQERSAAGVYVWMAEGTWVSGEEFRMQGDVTLIWTDQR